MLLPLVLITAPDPEGAPPATALVTPEKKLALAPDAAWSVPPLKLNVETPLWSLDTAVV